MSVRSSLARHQPKPATGPDELHAMRRRAWREQGIAIINPDDVYDDWERQSLINQANRLYGPRRETN